MSINYRAANGYDEVAASDEATIPADQQGESLTVQSQAEDADINVLMKRFGVTGKLPENPRVPTFGDFSGVNDFQSAMHAIREAEDAFMEFPADVRSRFENDPQKLMEFVADDKNYQKAVELGLMKSGAKAPTPVGVAPVGGGSSPSSGSPGVSPPVQSG